MGIRNGRGNLSPSTNPVGEVFVAVATVGGNIGYGAASVKLSPRTGGGSLPQEVSHPVERLGAEVMLDPFGIDNGRLFAHAQFEQKLVDQLVPFLADLGQPPPLGGQLHRLVGLGLHQAFGLQPLDHPQRGNVADPESIGQLADPALPLLLDQFGDRFDVVLGGFLGVILTRPPVGRGAMGVSRQRAIPLKR